jgi:nucleotide-binding universal stress UspA family protein
MTEEVVAMSQLDGIVLPLDGSGTAERATPVVATLAAATGAEVTLVTSTWGGVRGATVGDLDRAAAALAGGVVHRLTLSDRPAAEAAVDAALADEGRLLCMSTHGRGGVGRAVLGSVAAEVVRLGVVPVLLVGPGCHPATALDRPGPILLCVDGSDRSGRVVEAGAEWADRLDRDLRMVTVVDPFDAVTPLQLEETFARLRPPLDATRRVVTAARRVGASVPSSLLEEADVEKSPLLVVAPATASRWRRLLVGSTTLAILHRAPCPVLVLPEEAAA